MLISACSSVLLISKLMMRTMMKMMMMIMVNYRFLDSGIASTVLFFIQTSRFRSRKASTFIDLWFPRSPILCCSLSRLLDSGVAKQRELLISGFQGSAPTLAKNSAREIYVTNFAVEAAGRFPPCAGNCSTPEECLHLRCAREWKEGAMCSATVSFACFRPDLR